MRHNYTLGGALLRSHTFIIEWIAIPGVATAVLVIARWGQDNLVYVIASPVFVLLWRMWVLGVRRFTLQSAHLHAQREIANWHALGIVACAFLMAFEAGAAGLAGSRVTDGVVWLVFSACSFLPYMLISAFAERRLAKRIARSE